MEHSALGLRPGSVVQDTYRIDHLLGEGGMGATFKATNMATGHDVAIKVMSPAFSANKRAVELFRRESTLLRSVRNDAVIGYETTLMDGQGRLFLVMEFVDGKPLADYVRKGLRLKPEDVLALGARLAGGLASIHALGIVHRDVAPDNILIPHENIRDAKLIDFGLASDTIGTDKSIIGDSFAGKLSYSAPEQLGLHGNVARPATDAYALGLVLMKVAGLPVPGEGKGFAALDDRRHDIKITAPANRVPPLLVRVLEALLRTEPEKRPSDLAGLFTTAQAELAKAGGFKPEKPVVPTPGKQPQPERRGLSLPVIAALGVAVVAAIGIGFLFLRGDGPPKPMEDVALVEQVLAADDPLAEVEKLIATGDRTSLSAALGTLLVYQRDTENSQETRQRAAMMIAQMYDPATFDGARSPFDEPNAAAARRYYQAAADLGSTPARDALSRLQD